LSRTRFAAVVSSDAVLYVAAGYQVAVIALGMLSGATGRPPIVTGALVLGMLVGIALIAIRSLLKHRLLVGGAIAAALLTATMVVVLFADQVPKPVSAGIIVLYIAAGIAFMKRPFEI